MLSAGYTASARKVSAPKVSALNLSAEIAFIEIVLSHPYGWNTKIILASFSDLRVVLTMISEILHVLRNAYIFSHFHFVGEIHAVSYNGICIAILHHPGGAFDIWNTQKYHIMFCWHALKIRHKTFLCIYSCKDNNLFFIYV